MGRQGVDTFLLIWITVGTLQVVLLMFFPSVSRKMYVAWKAVWGLNVDPGSPILSDWALRSFGFLTAIIVGTVSIAVLTGGFAGWTPGK